MLVVNDRWYRSHSGGIGRFSNEVIKRLPFHQPISTDIDNMHPADCIIQSLSLRQQKASIYFNPGFNPPLLAPCPFVFTIHDLNHLHAYGNGSFAKKIYYELIIKTACYKAHKVLTVSDFSKKELVQWSGVEPTKVVNVGNAVSKEFCKDGPKHEPGYNYFFYIGNRKPHKNIDRLLAAYKSSAAFGSTKLLLSGISDKEIKHSLKAKNLTENDVIFTGFLSDKELPNYYRGATATLFPSLYEGFGLPIIESMACGTPVLTSNVTACPETAGGAALLVDPYDIISISSGMSTLFKNEKQREQLSYAGLEHARQFNWDKVVERVNQAIEK